MNKTIDADALYKEFVEAETEALLNANAAESEKDFREWSYRLQERTAAKERVADFLKKY